jgi:carbonic anhydrase
MSIKKTALLFTLLLSFSSAQATVNTQPNNNANQTSSQVLADLKAGNQRFLNNQQIHRDYLKEIRETSVGQYPETAVLNCMDSRNIPELTFDQGIGEIFAVRIAGNIVNDDILGSLEYATAVVHARLIVVMGHTSCGAVHGACKNAELGFLTALLAKIQPAIREAKETMPNATCQDPKFIDEIARRNVQRMVQEIPQRSSVIADLIAKNKVKIIGAMYDISTGKATFLEN